MGSESPGTLLSWCVGPTGLFAPRVANVGLSLSSGKPWVCYCYDTHFPGGPVFS